MLDRLRRGDKRGVQDLLVLNLAADFIGLLDDAVDRGTVDLLWLGSMHPEDLLDALHMVLGLSKMGVQR